MEFKYFLIFCFVSLFCFGLVSSSDVNPIGTTGPTWANDGQFKGEFNGVSSGILTLNTINLSEGFTFVSWVYPHNANQDNGFSRRIVRGDTSTRPYLGIHSTGALHFVVRNESDVDTEAMSDIITINDWYFVVGVYDLSSNNVSIYIDGSKKDETNMIGNMKDYSTETITIGQNSATDGRLNGSIDEVLVYNRSLSASEIALLYANYTLLSSGPKRTGTPSTDGLVLDINFDDYSVVDNSGSGNHGNNTNVTFGEVEADIFALIDDVDYVVSSTIFEIINADYSLSEITLNYDSGTCTCPSVNQNWEINLSQYCTLSDSCDLGTGKLNFTGTGNFSCDAAINTTNLGDPGANGIIYILDDCYINVD